MALHIRSRSSRTGSTTDLPRGPRASILGLYIKSPRFLFSSLKLGVGWTRRLAGTTAPVASHCYCSSPWHRLPLPEARRGRESGPFKGALDYQGPGCPPQGSRGGAPGTQASHAAGDAVTSQSSQPIRMEPTGTHY